MAEIDKLTEMVPKDWVSNTDVPRNAFVEASVRKDTECRSQMLLAVQSLLLKRVELGICSDLEFLAGRSHAESADRTVLFGRRIVDIKSGCHFSFLIL